jgi:tRNA-splicing endonuclease subunit Sen2
MLSSFTAAVETQQPKNKGGQSKKMRNAKQRYYSDPLPFAPPPPPFNVFVPSTYKALFAPPTEPHVGTWCPATRSVNVHGDVQAVEIWRRGMWGKGTLSRSQPTWRARKTAEMTGKQDSSLEAVTARTRKQRAAFKTERLMKERDEREKQRQEEAKEGGTSDGGKEGAAAAVEQKSNSTDIEDDSQQLTKKRQKTNDNPLESELPVYTEDYLDKETLQISPEDALFLMSLNLLCIHHNNNPLTLTEFLHLIIPTSRPDDPFLVRYIAYYHFRRQQLIVKTGLKFGVDYLIYHAPIPFVHAADCVNVVGDYHLWEGGAQLMRDEVSCQEVNLWQRLVGNVRKRMKIVYVEIPRAEEGDWRDGVKDKSDLERVLLRYRIREVLNSRLVIARERDKPSK